MRVNIYSEELGEGVDAISTTSRQGEVFLGIRVWLKTCQELLTHSTPEDDDRSALTFWAREKEELLQLAEEIRTAALEL